MIKQRYVLDACEKTQLATTQIFCNDTLYQTSKRLLKKQQIVTSNSFAYIVPKVHFIELC